MMNRKIRKAVFPVAGFGTRFLPATKAMPKELFQIVGTPKNFAKSVNFEEVN